MPASSERQLSGSRLLAVWLDFAGKCPVFTRRAGSAKTNHTWHIRTELALTHGSYLERGSLGRVTDWSCRSPAGALQCLATPGVRGHVLSAQRRVRNRKPV